MKVQISETVKWNTRKRSVAGISMAVFLLSGVLISSLTLGTGALDIQLDAAYQSPSFSHLFGTDWLGRDMLARTVKGLGLSLGTGLLAALISTLIALMLALLTIWNRAADYAVTWLIDLFLSIPHLVLLILISFTFSGGFSGTVIGLALTHWPRLTRLIRGELKQLQTADYMSLSRKLGKTKRWIARHHVLPHLLPQLFIGFVLLFPHAILHESALTFLGFGLPSEQPAIGIILSESMQYLSAGMWWLALLPGLSLFCLVFLFDWLVSRIKDWADPFHAQGI